MTSLCELGGSDHGGPTFSDYASDKDEDLVDTILALLDDLSPTSPPHSPRYSLDCKSTPPSIKKWVEGLPGNDVTSSDAAADSSSTPRNSNVYHSPSCSSSSPQSSSIFSQTDDERKTWSLRVSSLISEPPAQELPALPIKTSLRPASTNAKSIEALEFDPRRHDVTHTPELNSARFTPRLYSKRYSKRVTSMPEIKERASMVASITLHSEQSKKQTVTEFKFPLPPPFNWSSSDSNQQRQWKSLPSRHFNAKASFESQEAKSSALLTDKIIETPNTNPGFNSIVRDGNSKARINLRLSSHIITPRPSYGTHTHARSRSLAHWVAKESCAEESMLNHRVSCPPRQPRIASLLTPNKLHSIVEGDVFAVASLNEAVDKFTVPLIGDKQDPLDECLVFGSRARFLHIRRRSLTGTKVEWLVSDNGVVEHINARTDGKKLLLKCFSDSFGKVDFFTADGVSLFRFQRTVGSTRTALSFDTNGGKVYFQVRDVSWDCSAHWQVSLFNTMDQIAGTWLVTGDKQMQQLEVREGDRMVAVIHDSGRHQYKLKVFPNTNWCIVIALGTLFDEWRASRIGVAL